MAYNQDRKYEHFCNPSPKNIPENRAKDMGGMQGAKQDDNALPIKGYEGGQEEKRYGALDTEQSLFNPMKGEAARKPHEGGEPGKGGSK